MPRLPRHTYKPIDTITDIWSSLSLPASALQHISLPGSSEPAIPSSFKIGHLAQASIALSALAARLVRSTTSASLPAITVPQDRAVAEFRSNNLYHLADDGRSRLPATYHNPVGGLHRAKDGFVRVHDVLPNHVAGSLQLLGLPSDATREDVAAKIATWNKVDLETAATEGGNVAIYAVRSYDEWDALPAAAAVPDMPIVLKRIAASDAKPMTPADATQCLSGIKVVELTRVIAGPVAGKTLAAHGADVIWVTSPSLPAIPELDIDLSCGKRHVQLDLNSAHDMAVLKDLIRSCDVFIQSYRPESLTRKGLSPTDLAALNPNIVYGSLSAFGPYGAWAHRRGFDSLVQAATGVNVSEGEHAGTGPKPMPCQGLDHASGYFFAAGVMAALYRRVTEGGAWEVNASLVATMKCLRGLGQFPGDKGFGVAMYKTVEDVPQEMKETRDTEFGTLTALKHSAAIEGCEVGWRLMPRPPQDNKAEWV